MFREKFSNFVPVTFAISPILGRFGKHYLIRQSRIGHHHLQAEPDLHADTLMPEPVDTAIDDGSGARAVGRHLHHAIELVCIYTKEDP